MPMIKNVSMLGDLAIPVLGLEVKAGETFEVSAEAAEALLAQPDNFVAADSAPTTTPATPDAPAAE